MNWEAILADPQCAEWIMANVKHGCAPAFEGGRMCFRFQDDADAERFRERWLEERERHSHQSGRFNIVETK